MNTFALSRLGLIFLVLLTMGMACKKSEPTPEPTPPPVDDLASKVVGKYLLRQLSIGEKTYTPEEAQCTGTVTVARKAAATVSLDAQVIRTTDESDYLKQREENLTVILSEGGDDDSYTLNAGMKQFTIVHNNRLQLVVMDAAGTRSVLTFSK